MGEHWDTGLRQLAYHALRDAMIDAGVERVDALYVGNMLSGEISAQAHLGALIADFAGMRGIEAVKIEAACASGAAAVRQGLIGVASGMQDVVAVVGVEKMTDNIGSKVTAGLAEAADADYETVHGISFVGLNALVMRRYMYEYGLKHEDFAAFSVNAHANGAKNPNAMFRSPITEKTFLNAGMVADPISLFDASPMCDGAAAVILCPTELAKQFTDNSVRIAASTIATDSVAIHDRKNPIWLQAAEDSARQAYKLSGYKPEDMDFFELHDAFTIMSALSLEACGFAEPGQGTRLAKEGEITLGGKIPISTMGGLKSRGHPVGATGVYQIVESVLQLRGDAGENQIPNARVGMAQNIGGSGATIVTHILERNE